MCKATLHLNYHAQTFFLVNEQLWLVLSTLTTLSSTLSHNLVFILSNYVIQTNALYILRIFCVTWQMLILLLILTIFDSLSILILNFIVQIKYMSRNHIDILQDCFKVFI